jgi:bifunctional DNase/RNase
VVSDGFNDKEIDARASDAVVLALHQAVDIEMAETVLEETGFTPQNDDIELGNTLSAGETLEELEEELRICEENEEYERAEEIMKRINKIKNGQ